MERYSIENFIVDENELAEHYKETGNEYGYKGKLKLVEYLKELKTYKDAEEQGLLLRLPCKVGDTLYLPYSRPRYIKEVIVTDFMFNGCDLHILTDFVTLGNRDIGKTVFLTKESAEQALAEMKGE